MQKKAGNQFLSLCGVLPAGVFQTLLPMPARTIRLLDAKRRRHALPESAEVAAVLAEKYRRGQKLP